MVREILEGRKTQTRRMLKVQPAVIDGVFMHHVKGAKWCSGLPTLDLCPHGRIGDRLWVRETWTATWTQPSGVMVHLVYAADGSERTVTDFDGVPEDYALPKAALRPGKFVSPLFMPRWASRITLEITDVRVQRLGAISEEDAIAEGVERIGYGACCTPWKNYLLKPGEPFAKNHACARASFASLWKWLHGPDAWMRDEGKWVWAVTFKRIK